MSRGAQAICGRFLRLEPRDDARALLAFDLYVARLREGIGAMAASLGGIDALIFTGGVGEHASEVRAAACARLGWIGLTLDDALNAGAAADTEITLPESPVRVLVLHTREELTVARETVRLLSGSSASQESGAGCERRDGSKLLRDNLQAEIDGASLYRALAQIEDGGELATVYIRMAEAEERHAEIWRAKLREAGVTDLPTQPGWRTRTLIALAHRFGPGLILPTIVQQEQADSAKYDLQEEAREVGMGADERSHARLFRAISEYTPGLQGGSIARLEGRHRAGGGNALRAAVLGANDGLVSNASLVMGVAGAELSGQAILITGLAGLMAGSLSMALGEWLSVQSARELFEHQIGIEREELLAAPEEEAEELALIYQAKGLDRSGRELGSGSCKIDKRPWTPWRGRNWASIRRSWADPPGWRRSRRSSSLRWARSSPSCPISSSQGQQRSSSASC